MTGACPRCRAPIAGPICGACGLQLQAAPSPYAPPGYAPPGYAPPGHPTAPQFGYPPQAQQPPPYGYAYAPPPQMMPMQPGMQPGMQYIGPGGMPYVMMQVPNNLPSKKWAVAGGVMNIVTSSIYLLLGLLALIGASDDHSSEKGALMTGVFIFICLGVAGIIFGVYSVRGRWGGALGGGVLHSVLTLICFVGVGAVEEAKDRRRAYDYYDSYYESSADKGLEAVAGVLVLFALLSALTAIFCYIGISGAKNRARYEAHMRATEHF